MIAKCEFTYIQLAASAIQPLASAQRFTAGSTNRPSERSAPTMWRAFSNASIVRSEICPRTSRYSQYAPQNSTSCRSRSVQPCGSIRPITARS